MPKQTTSPPVFYVEKEGGESKNYESNYDKPTRKQQVATENPTTTPGVGEKGPSPNHPSKKRAPSTENKGNPKKRSKKSTKTYAEAENVQDQSEKPGGQQCAQDGEDKAHGQEGKLQPQQHEQGKQEEGTKQSSSKDGKGQGNGQEREGGEGGQPPVLTEREQKLAAAKQRAKELRQAKTEAARAAKNAAGQTKKHIDNSVDTRQDAVKPKTDPQDPPEVLARVRQEKQVEPLQKSVHTVKETAFPPNQEQGPPLHRSKTRRVTEHRKNDDQQHVPQQQHSAPTPSLPPSVQDKEEQELAALRRNLEKKRMLREEMQLDKELKQNTMQQQMAAPPISKPGVHKPQGPMDELYKNHLAQMKRSMLMDAIFGSHK